MDKVKHITKQNLVVRKHLKRLTQVVLFCPDKTIIELKSLKMYLQQYRDLIISHERLINVLYDDLIKVYKPKRLRIVLDCNPRGGISSRLTQDSDWKSLGGKEEYKNYNEDVW